MTNAMERLALGEAILALIDRKRTETADDSLGENIERAVLDVQLKELEEDILDDPGAFQDWLVRRRRG